MLQDVQPITRAVQGHSQTMADGVEYSGASCNLPNRLMGGCDINASRIISWTPKTSSRRSQMLRHIPGNSCDAFRGQATMFQLVSTGSVLLQVSLSDSKCFVQVLCDQRSVTITAWFISQGFARCANVVISVV